MTDPLTGEPLLAFGIFATPATSSGPSTTPPNNGTYLFLRRENGTYQHQYVFAPNNTLPAGESLRAVRAVELSPFPEDQGRALYVGGYDAGIDTTRLKRNTAWIYRASVP